ncbi:STAS domain-containing protein [Aquimarina pacifica]|uniref:STAS domain-containing protein n=1 Tax=Aquimarina pacifica TaxID=1296415 RepID=UPI00046F9950|nr:STAS domain-containing protein [Aquimarina pacifica]
MAFKITNNQGILEVNGNIIGENTVFMRSYFEELLSDTDKIVLSLDHVKTIDLNGVEAVTTLCKKAMELNKIFYVIGKDNRSISNAFGKMNYILRHDFI